MSDVWYSGGLKFACEQCGACCTGEPGYVWLTAEELRRLADHLGLTVNQFRKRYARKVFGRTSLKEHTNGDCVFFDRQTGCRVYDLRPMQCRTWPFWTENLSSPTAWQVVCEGCPGAGCGRLHSVEQIGEWVARLEP